MKAGASPSRAMSANDKLVRGLGPLDATMIVIGPV